MILGLYALRTKNETSVVAAHQKIKEGQFGVAPFVREEPVTSIVSMSALNAEMNER